MPLLHSSRPNTPHLDRLFPRTAIPGGSFEVTGSHILNTNDGPQYPEAFFGEIPANLDLVRPNRALIRVPAGAISSDLSLRRNGIVSNPIHANIGVPMVEDLHLVSNPAIDADGNLFAMVSGPRGEQVPVSIFRVARDLQVTPFVRDVLNVSALAFGPDGNLYASSRAEGTIYRISPAGAVSTFAEGMGIATGIAFDRDGNLFVGDRSGTIFKIGKPDAMGASGEIFVYATLEPSMAAYHLAFNDAGTLFVTGPTTSSNQAIHAIDRDGNTTVFYQGLGRAQGMAFDVDDNLYVAASLHGQRGIVRIDPHHHATLAISGNNLVGLTFLEDGCAALATRDALYHVALDIEGRRLF